MEISLKNQVAVVTGASSGIGKGVAKSLAAAGATVVVNYPFEGALEQANAVLKEITDEGGKGITYQCDVSKEDQVVKMFQDVVSQLGTVDILINNAGIQKDAKFTEMTIDQWNAVIGVNLTGQFLCAREAIKEFLRRGIDTSRSVACGKIIHISSVHEIIPWAGHANYASSKGAIRMLMQTLAQEYGADKIRVNSICPGAIQTPINTNAWNTPEALNSLLTLIPYNRIGQPEDIGNLAVFLASDFSDYITGASIFVDGGMTTFESFSTGG
ncbi:glucose 1-dehydrogenase [Chryseobacterium shigense]|uniref:Glucose 1-dehydrogenase n=1 Tax=Chryseobacterium shigense TaxID=297244 RepID=A0A841NBD5_9FLAO|nr:glucose 1-dehydrogenase [Chryseobacterium shigense]MBB6372343.1 glucose 1-dehydrogenase [Chryseobacterium shigense]